MKKVLLSFCFIFGIINLSFSQCPFNLDFEQGSTVGWTCKSGSYGTGPCPTPLPGVCPTFNTIVNTIGCINNNGNNALLSTYVDRHTIMSNSAYGGTGIDPNSIAPFLVHAVDQGPFGGSYSFRLGDGVAGGVGTSCPGPPPNCYARAEAIRLTFMVDSSNAIFNYRYAVFNQDPGHWPEEQPRFEVLLTKPDSGDKLIPCGYLKVVAGSFNPSCPGTSGFHTGVGTWKYKDWSTESVNLRNYIGENIAVEFRTSDCFPGNGTPLVVCNGNCCTTTLNGVSCMDSTKCTGGPPWCIGIPGCTNQAGSHSCYAYIDAYCQPANANQITDTIVCGATSVTLCAPAGYACYRWTDVPGFPSTQCVNINNPVPGTTYHVNLCYGVTSCPNNNTISFTLVCPVGINELSESSSAVIISPNPAASFFTINLPGQLADADLSIYDIVGRVHLQQHLTTNKAEIPALALERGVYFARVKMGERVWTKKVLVE